MSFTDERKRRRGGAKLHPGEPRRRIALALAALAAGAIAGLVSIAFRGAIELCQSFLVPAQGFAALPPLLRFLLPVAGTSVAIGVLYVVARGPVQTGVVHVLARLENDSARLPLLNAIVQFVVASVMLAFGMSMGREGPAIHLGAASGGWLGARLRSDQKARRTLVGCGVAAALGAAFNTPFAGVVLAMEVVLAEYSVTAFVPILLAAFAGTALGRVVFGSAPALALPDAAFGSLGELPYVAALGIVTGAYAAGFIGLARFLMRKTERVPWWSAMLGASVLVGLTGIFVPQVLGIGYDIVRLTLDNRLAFGTLGLIVAGKLVATAAGAGARVPAGLIGPTFVMGAALGGLFGVGIAGILPVGSSSPSFYAMLGMAAMMGATLQAPLSALAAVVELTGNAEMLLPGILAVAAASLSTRYLFRCESIFVVQASFVSRASSR